VKSEMWVEVETDCSLIHQRLFVILGYNVGR